MSRLFSLFALAAVLWIFLEIGWARLQRAVRQKPPAPPLRSQDAREALVRCAGCGVHVPRSRVVDGPRGLVCEHCRA